MKISTGSMPFLFSNKQYQSTEVDFCISYVILVNNIIVIIQ